MVGARSERHRLLIRLGRSTVALGDLVVGDALHKGPHLLALKLVSPPGVAPVRPRGGAEGRAARVHLPNPRWASVDIRRMALIVLGRDLVGHGRR